MAELLTNTEMNLKLIYSTVIVLQTETIAIVLLYFFLGIYKKGLVVLYGFFLSLEAKVDCSQSSVFRIFSHCQRTRNVKSPWQFNERGVFSLVFRWREDPCTFLIVVSIKYFCPKLRKQFASKFNANVFNPGRTEWIAWYDPIISRPFLSRLFSYLEETVSQSDWSPGLKWSAELSIPGRRNNH